MFLLWANCEITEISAVVIFKITAVFYVMVKNDMNEFKTYHPAVNFIYFLFVIGFSMFFMHPVCLITSFLCAFLYLFILKGKKAFKSILLYIPLMLIMAIINPLFNHEGVTIILYFRGGNPLTGESIIYGLCTAVMIISVIMWFSCYSAVMTSDKFIYLFGKTIPSLSLVFSMTLRFVPRFIAQFKTVANAQRGIGRDFSEGNIIKRAKSGLAILSATTTWAMENSIDTADSMKARGYGLSGRTAFSVFKFEKRDIKALIFILIFGIYVLCGSIAGGISYSYFPKMLGGEISGFSVSIFLAYFALCIIPVIIEIWEVKRWNALKSTI